MYDSAPTAYHEAGHAVAHWLFNFPIERVSIVSEDDHLGAVYGSAVHIEFAETADDSNEVEKKLKNAIIIYLAGGEAQRHFDADTVETWHEEEDRENALEVLWHLGYPSTTLEIMYQELFAETVQLVTDHWKHIETLALALVEERELTGERVIQLLSQANEEPDLSMQDRAP